MEFLPLFFNLRDKTCLVIGGGEVAFRKAELLGSAGARVTVVSPEICEKLIQLVNHEPHQYHCREFRPEDLDDIVLVISATNDATVNALVATAAGEKSVPVNVVDDLVLSSVIFPTIIDRSPIILAASTGGKSPVLARKIRELLESLIPERYSRLATFLGERRDKLKEKYPATEERRRVTEAFLASPGEEQAMLGNDELANSYLFKETDKECQGEVYLVGAGPGDPELLTLKALQLMQKADVILYDNLVSKEVLSRAWRDASKRICWQERRQRIHDPGNHQRKTGSTRQGRPSSLSSQGR